MTNIITINIYHPHQPENIIQTIDVEYELLKHCQLIQDLYSQFKNEIYIPSRMETHPDYIKLLCRPYLNLNDIIDGQGPELIQQIKTLTMVFSFWGSQKLLDKLAMFFNRKINTDPHFQKSAIHVNDELHKKLEHKILSKFNQLLR